MVRATFLSFFFSMRRLVFPYFDDTSSEVMRRIMAVTASQRLMSQKDKGKFMVTLLL